MEFAGDREDAVIVVTPEQARLLALQPLGDLELRTLRTKPMATGVIPYPLDMAVRTCPPNAAVRQHRRQCTASRTWSGSRCVRSKAGEWASSNCWSTRLAMSGACLSRGV